MIDLDKTLSFYASALRGISQRQRATAHNIANQNTPGYRAQTVAFERILGEAIEHGQDPSAASFQVEDTPGLRMRPNGNNVDLEFEFMQLERNRLLHEIFARATGGSLRGMMTAIRSR